MNDRVQLAENPTSASALESAEGRAKSAAQPKSALVTKLLCRGKGATLLELQDATAWQPHSVRALLSGLRKKGEVLIKEERKSGDTAYRIAVGKAAGAPANA
jgi:hypothetical protein